MELTSNEIWKVTGGAEEHYRKEAERFERVKSVIRDLARCGECGGEARAVVFGRGGKGVWVGCDRSVDCSRNIEIHTEGWSLEETAREWNRYNGGWRRVLRKVKGWFRKRFGELARREREMEREKERKEAEKRKARGRIFGIGERRRVRFMMLSGMVMKKRKREKGS